MICNTINTWPNQTDEFIIVVNRDNDGIDFLRRNIGNRICTIINSNVISLPSLHSRFRHLRIFIKVLGYYGRYVLIITNIPQLMHLFQKINLDRLIIHNGGYPGGFSTVSAMIAAKISGIKKPLLIIHSNPVKGNIAQYPFDWYYDYLVQKFSRIICVSKKAAIEMHEIRKFRNTPEVIHNGVKKTIHNIQTRSYTELGKLNIAIVGRLSFEKGHHYLLDALKKIKDSKSGMDFQLHIFGKGTIQEEQSIRGKVSECSLHKQVMFHGFVQNIQHAIAGFDLLVLPTIDVEGLPMVILEAMSLAIPVIATDVGGVPEVIDDGINGIIIPPRNVDALAKAILLLMNNQELRTKIAKNGERRYITHFTAEKMANNCCKFLSS